MVGKDIITMSARELKRLTVIHKAIDKQITQDNAAEVLGLCDRQIRRIVKRIKDQGDEGIIHRSRGRPSNRAKPLDVRNKTLNLCRATYKDFNPTFASEKLFEINKINISPETLRLWFIEAGIGYKKRKAPKHRSWRPRKESFGQMVQMDGSHHAWFEDRGPESVFMGYIDDATGRIFGRFYDYEGTIPAMDSFKRYIKKYGIPQSVYLDKHTTYKSTKKPTIEEELNNTRSLSEFERALEELGVDVIHADSPQAKGRIERSFRTHQDRLIKEMRLQSVSTVKEANKFLRYYYIPKHNKKFAIPAKNRANLHRDLPKGLDLNRIFCIKTEATLRNDFTIRYANKFYQILDTTRAKKVMVEERLTGRVYISYKGNELKYKLIQARPEKPKRALRPGKTYIPPKAHPWRKFKLKCA